MGMNRGRTAGMRRKGDTNDLAGTAGPPHEPPLVVVLGASGFIGSAVVRELARRPIRLRCVARGPVPVPAAATARIEVRSADLGAPGELARAVEGADAVVHLVAYIAGPATWRVAEGDTAAERVNVGLAHDLIEALRARRERRSAAPPPTVVFAGTTTQAGPTAPVRIDGSEPDAPTGTYDRQKLAAEQALKRATAENVLRGVVLRLPTVFGYGPASTATDKGVVSAMVRRALAGEPLTMWHDGTVRRDLLYVDDVARALVTSLDHADALAGRHWLLGTGHGEPLGEVFARIARIVADRTGRPPVPVVSVTPPEHAEASDFRSVEVDATAFRTATGWRPVTPLSEALELTVAALARQVSARA
ncbi:NAD-dependent epimerase/dehydratase family protein [Streptomyces sp. SP17KL33]|uniref:NAD-dependent epimerase/dehydratase family protein n=1 Tax=Streptomyces sp. SP17KL33 TaxID=3002534 RepID=UPI002E796F73|nr:NAD-dependent epimerase/dehydratase [Streptomyces sp. SP17KL33]